MTHTEILFQGTWRNGNMHGTMRHSDVSGNVTTVEYLNGDPASSGTAIYIDGRVYEGELRNFGPHGTGTMTAGDGSWEYRGEFASGQRWGDGALLRFSGDGAARHIASVYAGGWAADKKHGHGVEGSGGEADDRVAVVYEEGELQSSVPVQRGVPIDEEWVNALQLYSEVSQLE